MSRSSHVYDGGHLSELVPVVCEADDADEHAGVAGVGDTVMSEAGLRPTVYTCVRYPYKHDRQYLVFMASMSSTYLQMVMHNDAEPDDDVVYPLSANLLGSLSAQSSQWPSKADRANPASTPPIGRPSSWCAMPPITTRLTKQKLIRARSTSSEET
eukprot:1796611-Pyramimonas_sp.AAC.1